MSETILVPGGRDVRGSLDAPGDADACVVACPPHPQQGGTRTDQRLRAVADGLVEEGVACLRFDYGPWDEGRGELTDARNALAWARDEYEVVGLFGFSFGATLALVAAAQESADGAAPAAVSALSPTARLGPDLDAVDALADVACPAQVVYGERDRTVDWEPVVERARELGLRVEGLPGDHFFVGQAEKVADRVVAFFGDAL